jgi:hypothetical protein
MMMKVIFVVVKYMSPHVKIERLTQGNDRKRFYVGIELKPLLPLHNLSDKLCFENIV